jgi:CheY-like chemotaxis protein
MNPDAVLIVDDNPADVFIAEKAILRSRPECIFEHAGNGGEALDLVHSGNQPGLVLLDVKMPGMSGLDVLADIRNHDDTRYIPVVMLSSSTLGSDIQASYNAGANSYLGKTHDFDAFTEEIRSVLHYWLDLNKPPEAS